MSQITTSGRNLAAVGPRLLRLAWGESAGLALQQVALMALAVFSMMFATQDHSISRLFLGTFLMWCWLGLAFLNATIDIKGPTSVGDTIYVESEVTEARLTSKGDRSLVRFANKVINQRGETVLEYNPLRMLKRKP